MEVPSDAYMIFKIPMLEVHFSNGAAFGVKIRVQALGARKQVHTSTVAIVVQLRGEPLLPLCLLCSCLLESFRKDD